jgi:hypothetical protein
MSFLAASAQVAPVDLLTNGSFESAWELDALFRRRERPLSRLYDVAFDYRPFLGVAGDVVIDRVYIAQSEKKGRNARRPRARARHDGAPRDRPGGGWPQGAGVR